MTDSEIDWSDLPVDVDAARRHLDEWMTPQFEDYESWRPLLEIAEDAIESRLEDLLGAQFKLGKDFQVTGQVKQWDSIAPKLEAGRFADWSKVTDLVRFRISTPSLGLVSKIRSRLDFHILDGTIDEKRWWQSTGAGRGYAAVHFQLRYEPTDLVPESQYDCGAEVQIQTNLQAAWSELTHAFYKSSFMEITPEENYGAPALLREKVFRLAAALELLDEEIQAVKDHFPEERKRVIDEVNNSRWKSVPLDEVALCSSISSKFVDSIESIRVVGRELGLRESAWPEHVRPGEECLGFLRFAERNGIRTLGDFSSALHRLIGEPDRLAMARLGRFIELERERASSLDDFLVINRPLFLIAIYLGFENPTEVVMTTMLRHSMLSSYWAAMGTITARPA